MPGLDIIGGDIMSKKTLTVLIALLVVFCAQSFAAKPDRNQTNESAAPVPQAFAVKVDYNNGLIIVEGENLDPSTATGTIAGVSMSLDGGASTANTLFFPFTSEIATAVDELGNYILNISNDGGSLTLSIFVPFALVVSEPPPPPGPDCPCSTEWDQKSTTASPGGFSGQTPYCSQDTGQFVTVQFYDQPAGNYWVLWTEWNGSSGYCELYIDLPPRSLSTEDEFNACAGYLRNIVTVWGDQGLDFPF
jgi:hypothetical protein